MLGSRATQQDDWFCEPTADDGWECVQDADRVAKAQPRRLPKKTPAAAPTAPAPSPKLVASVPALPLYQELAYQPAVPVALTELPADFYAIQLLALSSRQELEQFVMDNGLHGMAAARIESKGQLRHVLLAGIYQDQATAERAAASLPENLRVMQPWVRALDSLQGAMRRADELLGADI